MHASEISQLETGLREPGLIVQWRLATALDMTLGELMLLADREGEAALRQPQPGSRTKRRRAAGPRLLAGGEGAPTPEEGAPGEV